jgi:hypothetical protein
LSAFTLVPESDIKENKMNRKKEWGDKAAEWLGRLVAWLYLLGLTVAFVIAVNTPFTTNSISFAVLMLNSGIYIGMWLQRKMKS